MIRIREFRQKLLRLFCPGQQCEGSNVKMDAITAMETYRNRDLEAFGNPKEKLILRRALVSSETSLSGKLFVETSL